MSKKRSIGHIKKLSEGKYLLRLSLGFDDFGKRLQPSKVVECSSDREAEKQLLEFYNEKKRLQATQTAKVPETLQNLYDEWYSNHIKINLTEKTAEFYSYLWDRHVKQFGKLKLKNASPKHIYSILQNIETDRAKNGTYKMLKTMFNKAVKWGYMAHNPCEHIDTPKYKAKEKGTLTEEDIQQVMKALPDEELKFQAIFHFATLCGMRRQEILGLKWSDIDFKSCTVTIQRAATELQGKGTVTKDTKTDKSNRILPISDTLKSILLKHKAVQNRQRFRAGNKWNDEDWIFTQWDGKLMCLQTPSHWWKDFAEKIGIENVTFHGLRHTAASYMIKNNIPISTVSGVLGHANTSTTLNIYTHIIEDTKRDAINVMADIINMSAAQ